MSFQLNRASSTALATAMAFLTVGSIPTEMQELPSLNVRPYGTYSSMNAYLGQSSSSMTEDEQAEVLGLFALKLFHGTSELDPEVSQIVSDDFWDMYERF